MFVQIIIIFNQARNHILNLKKIMILLHFVFPKSQIKKKKETDFMKFRKIINVIFPKFIKYIEPF